MKKEEFLSFLETSLDELARKNSQTYEGFNYHSVNKVTDSEQEEEVQDDVDNFDYYDDEIDDSANSDLESSGLSEHKSQQKTYTTGDVASNNDVLSDFTDTLFDEMRSNFKPSREVKNGVFSTQQPFERMPEELNTILFCGSPFKYTRYEKPLEIPEITEVNSSDSFSDKLQSFRDILDYMMHQVEEIYGGFDRITDLAVVSGLVVINGVSFEPLLKDNLIKSLPYDLQYSVRNGCFAYMFDYRYIPVFKNLVNLKFDDVDFLFSKVRIDLNRGRNFEPKDMFSICRKLNVLQVGENIIYRRNLNSCDDIFRRVRRSTEIADKLETWGFNTTKASWGCVRDIFMNSNSKAIWKGLKLATMIGVSSAVTAGTVGFKAARVLTKVGSKVAKGVGDIITAVKENS